MIRASRRASSRPVGARIGGPRQSATGRRLPHSELAWRVINFIEFQLAPLLVWVRELARARASLCSRASQPASQPASEQVSVCVSKEPGGSRQRQCRHCLLMRYLSEIHDSRCRGYITANSRSPAALLRSLARSLARPPTLPNSYSPLHQVVVSSRAPNGYIKTARLFGRLKKSQSARESRMGGAQRETGARTCSFSRCHCYIPRVYPYAAPQDAQRHPHPPAV